MARKTNRIAEYVELRARTPYSLLEGAIKIDDLAVRLRELRMPAIGLADTNNMCAALEFSEKMCDNGIQPIIGCTLMVDLLSDTKFWQKNNHDFGREFGSSPGREFGNAGADFDGNIVLLVQNEQGYANLLKLSSSAFLDASANELPHIKFSQLKQLNDGLIALTGGPDGFVNRLIVNGQTDIAKAVLKELSDIFKRRLYVELQRHDLEHEKQAEPHLIDMAYELELPLVASNEPYFLDPDMHKAHDALLAISEASYILETDRRHVSKHHYLKMPDDMVQLFADLPEAIENTIDIAKRCAFRSPARKPILPGFGDGSMSEDDILAKQARQGLKQRLAYIEKAADESEYYNRLEFELEVISKMGFPGYFLIVADFIQWAKSRKIPVGPGRGSGAGSVVAWALTITDLDPLRYGLLFERFLNPERISMPDFDIDFCQERRGEVIEYVQEKYGKEQVAHIITFGTLQARAVVRDVGRVLQMPLPQVDRLAKLVPSNPADPVSLAKAIKLEPELKRQRDNDHSVAELLTIALQLEGLYRNASTHAAGVVIADRPLQELVPLYLDPRSDIPATQFSMKWAEKAGLVKFDFLGLKTLTVIDRAIGFLRKQDIDIDMDRLDVKDKKAYAILADGLSQGVFQLESAGMRDVLRQIKPDSIEELTAIISLYRPGPMRNIPDYIERKHGRKEITYPHPSLKSILTETYGIIIYQEQVMQIAQILSGYSLGEADVLRRAMGKKDKEEMAKQKARFVDGAMANGVKSVTAKHIFELVNEFAGYGFNKSHAAAYAMIAFRTAWLKAHYPPEFLAASMSLDIGNIDKLSLFVKEARRLGVEVVSPCVNKTFADFEVEDGRVLYALGAIKNVGVEAMRHLVEVREQDGKFKDLFDFARRIDARIVNKRAYENLVKAGAFDELEPNRAKILASVETLLSIGARAYEERNSAQSSLFGGQDVEMAEPELSKADDWSEIEKLEHEMQAVGFYLSGHPLSSRQEELQAGRYLMAEHAEERHRSGEVSVRMAGVLHKKQERVSQRTKKRFAYLTMSDPTGEYEVFCGEELLNSNRDLLQAGQFLDLMVKLDLRDGELRFSAVRIALLPDKISKLAESANKIKTCEIYINNGDILQDLRKSIENLQADENRNKSRLNIIIPVENNREMVIKLQGYFGFDKQAQALIKKLDGVDRVVTV